MDWVHCNVCSFQPGQLPKRTFNLTSCGHIFCHCCERSGTIEKCKMCGVRCTTTPLSAEMSEEVQVYFEDPETALHKQLKVLEFQKSHRQRLNEYYRKLVEKYHLLKRSYQHIEEENKSLKKELEVMKRNQGTINMTPPSKAQLPLFSKNSQASKAIRLGMSQRSSTGATSPFFITPSNSSQQQYRSQKLTPITPNSDVGSVSPASVSSNHSYRSRSSTNSQQIQYKPGFTPPISSLKMLSVNVQSPRNPTRY